MFVDFDGTLAPIVDDPAAARPHGDAVAILAGLAGKWGKVAVVSGRPAAFLVEHLAGASGTDFLGLYGLEQASGGSTEVTTRADAERWRDTVGAAAAEAERTLPAGTSVERKGLTVTLHYRSSPGARDDVEAAAAALAERHGLDRHDGKMSVELRPPVDVDKGTVVSDLASGLAAVAFAGDDIGDLPAFAALDRLRASGTTTLSVASGSPETPAPVTEAADVTVQGPDGILELLRRLAGAPGEPGEPDETDEPDEPA